MAQANYVKFLTGTDKNDLPEYSASTLGTLYFLIDTTDTDVTKWNGQIIYDSPNGRLVMSTNASTAVYDTRYNKISDYIYTAEVQESDGTTSDFLKITTGEGKVTIYPIHHVEVISGEDSVTIPQVDDTQASSTDTYSSSKIESLIDDVGEITTSEDYIDIPEINDNVVSTSDTYSSYKIESTFTKIGEGGSVTDVKVNGTSVVTDKVANINGLIGAKDEEASESSTLNADTLQGYNAAHFDDAIDSLETRVSELNTLSYIEASLEWEDGSISSSGIDFASTGWMRTKTKFYLNNYDVNLSSVNGRGYIVYYLKNGTVKRDSYNKNEDTDLDEDFLKTVDYIRLAQKIDDAPLTEPTAKLKYINIIVNDIIHNTEAIVENANSISALEHKNTLLSKFGHYDNVYLYDYPEETTLTYYKSDGTSVVSSVMGTKILPCPEWIGFQAPEDDTTARIYLYIGDLDSDGNFVLDTNFIFYTTSSGIYNYLSSSRLVHVGTGKYFYYRKAVGNYKIIGFDEWETDLDDISRSPFSVSSSTLALALGKSYVIPAGCDYMIQSNTISGTTHYLYYPEKTLDTSTFISKGSPAFGTIPEDAGFGLITIPTSADYEGIKISVKKHTDAFKGGAGSKAHEKAVILSNITWSPTEDTNVNWSDSATNYYTANRVYAGIPYASRWYNSHYVGYEVSLFTMMSAIKDPYSIMWDQTEGRTEINSSRKGPGYGLVCTTFGSHMLGASYPQSGRGMTFDSNFMQSSSNSCTPGNVYVSHEKGHCVYVDELYDNGFAVYEQYQPCCAKTTHTGGSDYKAMNSRTNKDLLDTYVMNTSSIDRSLLNIKDNKLLDTTNLTPTEGDIRPWRGDKSVYGPWDKSTKGTGIGITIHNSATTATIVKPDGTTVTKDVTGLTYLSIVDEVTQDGTYTLYGDINTDKKEYFRYFSHDDVVLALDPTTGEASFNSDDVLYCYVSVRGQGVHEWDGTGTGSMTIANGHCYKKIVDDDRLVSVKGAIINDPTEGDSWGKYTAIALYTKN